MHFSAYEKLKAASAGKGVDKTGSGYREYVFRGKDRTERTRLNK